MFLSLALEGNIAFGASTKGRSSQGHDFIDAAKSLRQKGGEEIENRNVILKQTPAPLCLE